MTEERDATGDDDGFGTMGAEEENWYIEIKSYPEPQNIFPNENEKVRPEDFHILNASDTSTFIEQCHALVADNPDIITNINYDALQAFEHCPELGFAGISTIENLAMAHARPDCLPISIHLTIFFC